MNKENLLIKAKKYAVTKNGECLSSNCFSVKENLEWKCNNQEHDSWEATYQNILYKKNWCPQCLGKKQKETKEEQLENAKKFAKLKGGLCLSIKFENVDAKLIWKCDNPKHDSWEATYWSVVQRKNKSWCPQCAGYFSKEFFLEKAKEHALKKGGECLSEEYIKSQGKLLWKCSNENHEPWLATYSNVINHNRWCPRCADFHVKEHQIRDVLQYLLNAKFNKAKEEWNINPKTKRKLELDGYNDKLKIAFEFQGKQHYNENHFGNTVKDLEEIKFRDETKKQNCVNNNVKLLIFDDDENTNTPKKMLDFVIKVLNKESVNFNKEFKFEEVEKIFYKSNNFQKEQLEKAKNYAISKKGECLSELYIDNLTPMKWKCENLEHNCWESSFVNVVTSKTWCPECANKFSPEVFLKRAKEYAESKGGKCLSNEHVNNTSPLLWKCNNPNHDTWLASFAHKSWCPQCYGRFSPEYKLNKVQEHAKSKNGKCLSEKYINAKTKLEWKCDNSNHSSWFASYDQIINHGSWCPYCYKNK